METDKTSETIKIAMRDNIYTKNLQVYAESRGIRIRQSEEVLDGHKEDAGNATKQYSVKSSKLVLPVSSYFIPR